MSGTDSKGIRGDSLERWSLNLGVRPARQRDRGSFRLKEGEVSLRK